eukprot:jgi/Chrzof1/6751/Cz19g08020.t1
MASEFTRKQWAVLNSAIALVGYWAAAWLVDKPWYGRRFMQLWGFWMLFIFFLVMGATMPQLSASVSALQAFQLLFFLSSFWNQLGPNCTTWLVAGENGCGSGADHTLRCCFELQYV